MSQQEDITIAKMATDLEYIKRDISDIKAKMRDDYVTHAEFAPVKQVVFGLVAVILLAVVGAIVALVIKQ